MRIKKSHKSHLNHSIRLILSKNRPAYEQVKVEKQFWCNVKRFNTFYLTLNGRFTSINWNMRSIEIVRLRVRSITYTVATRGRSLWHMAWSIASWCNIMGQSIRREHKSRSISYIIRMETNIRRNSHIRNTF